MATEATHIDPSDGGRWQVLTASYSAYLLDLDAMTQTRIPANPNLRRDYETVPLLKLERVAVGVPMVMLIDLRRDGIATTRTTNLVTQIWRLDDGDGGEPT